MVPIGPGREFDSADIAFGEALDRSPLFVSDVFESETDNALERRLSVEPRSKMSRFLMTFVAAAFALGPVCVGWYQNVHLKVLAVI